VHKFKIRCVKINLMQKKLTKKEREENVTKGYLQDQNYVTKDFLKSQNYVTADMLRQTERNLGVMFEAQNDKIEMFAEAVMGRFEILENKMDGFNKRLVFVERKLNISA